MKKITGIFAILLISILAISCGQGSKSPYMNILFLHHSTGGVIWKGGGHSLKQFFKEFNQEYDTNYYIEEKAFHMPISQLTVLYIIMVSINKPLLIKNVLLI